MAARVAVFGSSEPDPSDPLYDLARSVGRLLAEAGFEVITGGYGGVMEAASRGAREAGGFAVGVTTSVFSRGGGNRYLSREITEKDLHTRTRSLIESGSAYIILPGKAGTLAELAFLWALHRANLLNSKPIVLLGSYWDGFVEELTRRGLLEPSQAAATIHARTPEEAVQLIRQEAANP